LSILHVGQELPRLDLAENLRWKLTTKSVAGSPVETIVEEAKSWEADLILMATAGHQGFLDVIRGSTSERVLRHAPCPVLTVPAADERRRG
jgi:nucleotide-binding universal stress UspA family protein